MNDMETTNNDSDTLFEVFFSLPEEIYVNIFSFLEPSDLSLGVSLVSHSWNYFSSSDLLWRPLFYRKFGARGLSKVLAVKLSPESDGHYHELQHEQEEETEVEAEQVSHDKYDWKGLYRYKSSMDQVWYGNSNKHPRVSKLRVQPPASYVSSPTQANQRANDSTSFFGYNSMKGLRCGPNLSDLCVFTSVGKEIVRRTFNMDQWTNQRVHNGDDEEDVQDSAAVDTNNASGVEVVDADVVFPVQSQFTWSIDYNPIRFGNRMISGGIENCLRVWNADSGELVHGIEVQKCGIWSNRILDSSHVVAGFSDNLVKVFDVNNASQPVAVYTENEASVYDVDCDSELPETNLFVTGSSDKSVRVFDIRVPNESVIKLKDLPDAIYELECSQMASDNIVIAGTNRGSILMIDIRMASNEDSANTASLVCNFPLAYGSAIRQMSYNGKRLVVCLSYGTVVVTTDRSVEVNFTPQELSELYRNHIDVQQIALTPNLPFRVTNMFTDRESMCMYADDEVMMVGTSANYLSLLDFRTTARPAPQVTHQTDERSPLRKPSTCLLQ